MHVICTCVNSQAGLQARRAATFFSGGSHQKLGILMALLRVACPLYLDTRNEPSRGIVQLEAILPQRLENATQSAHVPVFQPAMQPYLDYITRRKLHEIASLAALTWPKNGLKRHRGTDGSIAEVCIQHALQTHRCLLRREQMRLQTERVRLHLQDHLAPHVSENRFLEPVSRVVNLVGELLDLAMLSLVSEARNERLLSSKTGKMEAVMELRHNRLSSICIDKSPAVFEDGGFQIVWWHLLSPISFKQKIQDDKQIQTAGYGRRQCTWYASCCQTEQEESQ